MSASGEHWSGEFGYGRGQASECVKFIACPHCKSPVGKLCCGKNGPKLETHYVRRKTWTNIKRANRR